MIGVNHLVINCLYCFFSWQLKGMSAPFPERQASEPARADPCGQAISVERTCCQGLANTPIGKASLQGRPFPSLIYGILAKFVDSWHIDPAILFGFPLLPAFLKPFSLVLLIFKHSEARLTALWISIFQLFRPCPRLPCGRAKFHRAYLNGQHIPRAAA